MNATAKAKLKQRNARRWEQDRKTFLRSQFVNSKGATKQDGRSHRNFRRNRAFGASEMVDGRPTGPTWVNSYNFKYQNA